MSAMLWAGVKRIGRFTRTSFAVVGLGATGAGASYVYQQRQFQEQEDSCKPRVLTIPFHRLQLVKKHEEFDRLEALAEARGSSKLQKIAVEDLVDILHEATADPGIVAIWSEFGHGRSFGGGPADTDEVRTALRIFKESHRVHLEPNFDHKEMLPRKGNDTPRPLLAYADTFASPGRSNNPDYYLASIFTEIYLQQQGCLNLFGFGGTVPLLRKSLEKYGAKVHCYKHGAFKNAPNTFTHSFLTKEHKQNMENYLHALNDSQNRDMDLSRKHAQLTPDLWNLIQNSGSFTPVAALKMGLIDQIVEQNPLHQWKYPKDDTATPILSSLPPKKLAETMPLGKYRRIVAKRRRLQARTQRLYDYLQQFSQKSPYIQQALEATQWYQILQTKVDTTTSTCTTTGPPKETIALLHIHGTIDGKMVRKLASPMAKIDKDNSIKAVVVRVDSPGGTIEASETILQQLRGLKPPVVVSFGNVAASGGYYLASHADTIFASKNTITGSIGVYGVRFDLSGVAAQYGVRFGHVATSDFALSDDPFAPITRAQHANSAQSVDRAYERFREVVATGRDLEDDYVKSLAEGRIWTGGQAKYNGLVDEIGGWSQAIDYAQQTYCTSDNVRVVDLSEDRGYAAQLSRLVSEGQKVFSGVEKTSSSPSFNLGEAYKLSLPKTLPSKAFGVYLTMDENAAIRSLLESGSSEEEDDSSA